jgi:hypothetical protein
MQTARKQGCDRDRQRAAWDLVGKTKRAATVRLAEEGARIYMVDRNSTSFGKHSDARAQWMKKLLLWRAT